MPIYEYECPEHGAFEELRPMLRCSEGASCPECAAPARRVLSLTRTNIVPRARSVAYARNEKSQHAPDVRPHGCDHPRESTATTPRPGQLRPYRGKRPWVMEHG